MKFTVIYKDSEGADEQCIGEFNSRDQAVAWMFKFADETLSGCEVDKCITPEFEHVSAKHPCGAELDMWIIQLQTIEEFVSNFNT